MTKLTQIVAGNFAGKDSKGNYSGYNAKGERIFVHRKAMEALGWKADKDVKFPFYAVTGTREFAVVDDNNEPVVENGVEKKFSRMQALSIYTSKEDMISGYNSDAQLEIEAKGALLSTAKAQNLTEEAIASLMAASI